MCTAIMHGEPLAPRTQHVALFALPYDEPPQDQQQ